MFFQKIIIYKFFIKYVLHKTIPAKYQNKKWRLSRKWYINGKHNECEKFQLRILKKHIKYSIQNTDDRIHLHKNKIYNVKYPLKLLDGFEYTENFDGKFTINKYTFYLNLKFVCDKGGAQTRTLRESFHFINSQFIISNKNSNIYFINILDGDTSHLLIPKFLYLHKKFNKNKKIFIGDLHTFLKSKLFHFIQNISTN